MEAFSRYFSFIGYEADFHNAVRDLRRFRKALFFEELGWDVHVEGDEERDQFDHQSAIHCALYQGDAVVGGFRAIPTTAPYLSREVFSHLAADQTLPERPDVYEISRLGVVGDGEERLRRATVVYGLMMHLASVQGLTALVAVADLTYERFLRRLGIATNRYGPPQVIGTDRFGRSLRAVVGEIPMRDQSPETLNRLAASLSEVEIDNEALVFGRRRLSA